MPDAARNRNRPKGSPSHRREQRQSSRSHRRASVRQANVSSSTLPSRTHRRPAQTTHVGGDPRQTTGGGEGNKNDGDENIDGRQQQATLVLLNRTPGYHVDNAPYRRDTGPDQSFHERGEGPRHMFNNSEAVNVNGQAGQYAEEAGSDERSMMPSQGSASQNSDTGASELAHRVAGWHTDVQRQFMHGTSPWSPWAIAGRGLGVRAGAGEEEGSSRQPNYSWDLDLSEEDGDN